MPVNHLQILFIHVSIKNLKAIITHQLKKPSGLFLTFSVLVLTSHIQGQQGLKYLKTTTTNAAIVNASENSSATATCTATLIRPISIALESNMEFGTIVLAGSDGKVILDPKTNSCSATGGVYLQSFGPTPQLAEFIVTGDAGHSYSLSIPSSISLLNSRGDSLNFVIAADTLLNKLDISRRSVIRVGGTLFVPSNSVEGTYTSTTELVITVQYN